MWKGIGREESSIDLEEEMMAEVATVGLEDSALQEAGFRTEEVRVPNLLSSLFGIFSRDRGSPVYKKTDFTQFRVTKITFFIGQAT